MFSGNYLKIELFILSLYNLLAIVDNTTMLLYIMFMTSINNNKFTTNLPKPANILDWLEEMLSLENASRTHIVDSMLTTYIQTCADLFPQHLDDLVLYLQTHTNREEFKKALNIINLVIAMTFIAQTDQQFQQAMRQLLLESRHDSVPSQIMKLYYLNNLDQDDFSGIVFNEQQYQEINDRILFFKEKYTHFFS